MHISVCICTFKRPHLLKHLLEVLDHQKTNGLFNYSIIVVDNDHLKSAMEIVQSFQQRSKIEVQYCVEPEQNIALARNRAIDNATGELIAFIDDDEFPVKDWLLTLFTASLKNAILSVSSIMPGAASPSAPLLFFTTFFSIR